MSFDDLFRKDRPDEALETIRDAQRVGENQNGRRSQTMKKSADYRVSID